MSLEPNSQTACQATELRSNSWWLLVEAGPDAGHTLVIPATGVLIGRSCSLEGASHAGCARLSLNDSSVSAEHLAIGRTWVESDDGNIVPLIEPLTSTNGVVFDGERLTHAVAPESQASVQLRLGATVILITANPPIAAHADLSPALPDGRQPFHRPPRPIATTNLAPIYVPPARPEVRSASRLGVTALLAPIVIGGVLAVLVNPQLALLALSSPVLMLGNWVEDRRRVRRETSNGLRSTQSELIQFQSELAQSCDVICNDLTATRPGLGTLRMRAELPLVELWERRPDHSDCGLVVLGQGTRTLPHPLRDPRNDWLPGCHETLTSLSIGHDLPVTLSLLPGSILGIHGERDEIIGVARSMICQALLTHGPADLGLAIIGDAFTFTDWKWTATAPHTGPTNSPLLSRSLVGGNEIIETLTNTNQELWTIVVLDLTDQINHTDQTQLKTFLSCPPANVALVVLGSRVDRLPNNATTVIAIDGHTAYVKRESEPTRVGQPRNRTTVAHHPPHVTTSSRANQTVIATSASTEVCELVAVQLSTLADTAEVRTDLTLPDRVTLGTLLSPTSGPSLDPVAATLQRWELAKRGTPSAPFAVSGTGIVTLNLATDGPHGLIAGTTGSGKSELLRSLIASLAAHHPPTLITFVLIDYKGGAAFDALSRLPHVVGMVTDLDAGLGQRALRCLEAELKYREHLLHEAQTDDIVTYTGTVPLPRLVVVIDEFATMAADLPDFVTSLVGIAQRGRSLGVHLILATQRPAGAVNDSIRANMNLRISLRVQSTTDSVDVLGVPDAATLSRKAPGRALVRTGPSELVAIQTASSTIATPSATQQRQRPPACVEDINSATTPSDAERDGLTDLTIIIESAIAAAKLRRDETPRRPWPQPLAGALTSAQLSEADPLSCPESVFLSDLPDEQRQVSGAPHLVDGRDEPGTNVLLIGSARSGNDRSLAAVVTRLAEAHSPEKLHMYLIDFGSQLLAPLAALPHVGALITPSEPSRLARLVRQLTQLIEDRRSQSADIQHTYVAQVVIAIDNWTSLRTTHEDLSGTGVLDGLNRIITDGPRFGITTIVSIDRPNAMTASLSSTFANRYAFELVDPLDDSILGIGRSAPARCCPGRALDLRTMTEVQFAIGDELTTEVARIKSVWAGQLPGHSWVRPRSVPVLPAVVAFALTKDSARGERCSRQPQEPADDQVLRVRFALGDQHLEAIGWDLSEGEHGIISGGAGTGKTSALATVAMSAKDFDTRLQLHVLCGRRKRLGDLLDATVHRGVNDLRATLDERQIVERKVGQLILIDDAEFVDDDGDMLSSLIAERRPGLWVVAAARPEAIRSSYGHFTTALRRSRQGFALRPQREIDGELWMTPLPRRKAHDEGFPPGRGFLIRDGGAELAQVMVNLDERWLDAPVSTKMSV